MRFTLTTLGSAVALVLVSMPGPAHHSRAMFDLDTELTLEGIVTAFQWVNPHVHIEIDTGDRGVWIVEGQQPNQMSGFGWSRDSIAPGDAVVIVASPARNAERRLAVGRSVFTRDGGILLSIPQRFTDFGNSYADPPTPFVAEGLSGHWLSRRGPGALLQPRAEWPLTEQGRESLTSYDETLNPYQDCIAPTMPTVVIYPTVKRIEIGEDATLIQDEMLADRTVHMNVASHEGAETTRQGHSIGRWEGDVLVVDTTKFARNNSGNARGIASGPQKHLVERFELAPDGTSLTYRFELEDPEYLAEPVTGELQLRYRPDLGLVRVPCDVDTAGRFLIGE